YGQYQEAVVAIVPLMVTLKDRDSRVRKSAALALVRFGKAELIPILSEVIIRDPYFTKAYWLRAFTYLKQGSKQHKQAELDFRYCYEKNPTDINVGWMAEWCALSEVEPTADLSARLEELAAGNKYDRYNRYIGLVCRSVAALVRHDYQEARRLATEVVSLVETFWDGYFWLAMAHAYLGEFRLCMQNLDEAMRLEDPIPTGLLFPLAWLEKAQPTFYLKKILPWWNKYR
ncbi:MAG: HEAT repeat domain-containing protein, partial [Chloroflexota bacterium]